MPDIFDLNAIVPLAKAAIGRPDGARMTDKVSTMSTYSSFDVCRTLALLQGRAGALEVERPRDDIPGVAIEEAPGLFEVKLGFLYLTISICNARGVHIKPRNVYST